MAFSTLAPSILRVSKAYRSQVIDLQLDALLAAGVGREQFYMDRASGARADRPGLENCLRALRNADVLLVWRLDRLGRSFTHLVKMVTALAKRGVGLLVLSWEAAVVDTTTAAGRLTFRLFAALAEFDREKIAECTRARLAAARARGRVGGQLPVMTWAKLRLAQAAMAERATNVQDLCTEFGVSEHTLYRHVSPEGNLRERGRRVMVTCACCQVPLPNGNRCRLQYPAPAPDSRAPARTRHRASEPVNDIETPEVTN